MRWSDVPVDREGATQLRWLKNDPLRRRLFGSSISGATRETCPRVASDLHRSDATSVDLDKRRLGPQETPFTGSFPVELSSLATEADLATDAAHALRRTLNDGGLVIPDDDLTHCVCGSRGGGDGDLRSE